MSGNRDERQMVSRFFDAVPESVVDVFERVAERHGDRPALRHLDGRLTYAELNETADAYADVLRCNGVSPGGKVAISVNPSLASVISVLAVLKARASYVPIDPRHPEERAKAVLKDCGAAVVIADGSTGGRFSGLPVRVLMPEELGRAVEPSGRADVPAISSRDLAYTIYTSGSTGIPKGVEVEHGNVLSLVESMWLHTEPDENGVHTLLHSLSFDVSVWEIWSALLSGACLAVVPAEAVRAPDLLLDFLRRERVTYFCATPSVLHGLVEEATPADKERLAIRHIVSAGEVLPPEVARGCLDLCDNMWNAYGPTETTVYCTIHRVTPDDCRQPRLPIGRPFANARIHLLDENEEPVPPGTAGEIYISGPCVSRGYQNHPELNARMYRPDVAEPGRVMYRSGDLAIQNSDGLLEPLGRVDNQVKVNGYRIELEEIEARLRTNPAVSACAVLATGVGIGDLRLVACVVRRPGGVELAEERLRALLGEWLPPYMMPSSFHVFDGLPINTSGKVDRKALLAAVEEREQTADGPRIAPGADVALVVTDIWRYVLRKDDLDTSAPFFDLGGSSMLLLEVHRRLKASFPDSAPSVSELFTFTTVDALAKRIINPPREKGANRRSAGRRVRRLR